MDRNFNKITRDDIAEWQKTMDDCAECIAGLSDLYDNDQKETAIVAGARKVVGDVLHDMAFLVAYADSTLTASYGENVNLVAVEMQKMLSKKCKGEKV